MPGGIFFMRKPEFSILFAFLFAIVLTGCSTKSVEFNNGPLIDALTLSSNLSNGKFVVIDLQSQEEFDAAHLPGAIHIDKSMIEEEAFNPDGDPALRKRLEKILGENGIDPNDHLVLYDGNHNSNASRLWWLLKIYGHRDMCLLDGGINYWKEQGYETTAEKINPKTAVYHFSERPYNNIFASYEDVVKAQQDTNVIILDVRSLEEFKGNKINAGAGYGGNIDECCHLEFKSVLNEGGDYNQCFRDTNELKKLFLSKGITRDKKIIVYCHSGTRSSHTTFVLSELLGYKNVSNYDGSWKEWSGKQRE